MNLEQKIGREVDRIAKSLENEVKVLASGVATIEGEINDLKKQTTTDNEASVRLRELAARALEAGEAERKRISQELHDGTAQTLAALLVQLRLARDIEDGEVRAELMAETAEQLSDSIEELRAIARGCASSHKAGRPAENAIHEEPSRDMK